MSAPHTTRIDCAICRNFAWCSEMGPPVRDAGGRPHHPACERVSPPVRSRVGETGIATTLPRASALESGLWPTHPRRH